MRNLAAVTVALACFFGTVTMIQAAEEKTELQVKKDGSYKMKVKRKGDAYVGDYNGKSYTIRGDFGTNFRDDNEYTVYGAIDPNDSYITSTRIEPVVVDRTVTTTTTAVDDDHWNMRVVHRENDWVGIVGDKTYVLRGESIPHEEGEFTIHGRLGDGFVTTRKFERVK